MLDFIMTALFVFFMIFMVRGFILQSRAKRDDYLKKD